MERERGREREREEDRRKESENSEKKMFCKELRFLSKNSSFV